VKVASRVVWKANYADDAQDSEYHSPQKRKGRSTYKDPRKDPIFQSQSYLEWRTGFLGEDVWEYQGLIQEIAY